MTMLIGITRDVGSGITTVSLLGELTLSTASDVRSALLKTAAECPTAVVVDLAGLEQVAVGAASLFAATSRRVVQDWGVPLLLYGVREDVAPRLAPFHPLNPIYRDRWNVLNAVRAWVPRWRHARFAAVPFSIGRARHLVGEALIAWDLRSLLYPARLIVSELATNAIEHAGTGDFDVTLAYTTVYVRVAVQDHSATIPHLITDIRPDPAAPLTDRGFGLRIIADTATYWGTTGLADGKIVYALLRAHPVPATGT